MNEAAVAVSDSHFFNNGGLSGAVFILDSRRTNLTRVIVAHDSSQSNDTCPLLVNGRVVDPFRGGGVSLSGHTYVVCESSRFYNLRAVRVISMATSVCC